MASARVGSGLGNCRQADDFDPNFLGMHYGVGQDWPLSCSEGEQVWKMIGVFILSRFFFSLPRPDHEMLCIGADVRQCGTAIPFYVTDSLCRLTNELDE